MEALPELPAGQVHLEQVLNIKDPAGRAVADKLLRAHAELKKRMSPAGALNLPPLLDQRRLQYGLPDGCFRYQFAFDNISVFQLPMDEEETFGDTVIQKPDSAKDRERMLAPRGIIVSAGLRALDYLRSNGMDLGHIVLFSRLVPFRYVCDWVNGKTFEIVILTAGDIRASEDTATKLRTGDLSVIVANDNMHQYDGAGPALEPDRPEDFT